MIACPRMLRSFAIVTTLLMIAGVASAVSANAGITTASGGTTPTEKIDGDALLDPTRLLDIRITMAEEDWELLCSQSRNGTALFAGGAIDDPFTYFKANISIDGVEITSVGVRKKGFFGSVDPVRPSLKIKFDEYVEQDPVKGLSRLTFNNNRQDPSQLSQILTYKVFRDAGVHAPRCNMAEIAVNGEPLGIYSHVESIKKPFLKRSFGDKTGNLYEGAISDFHHRSVDQIEVKTNKSDNDRADLHRLAELLAEPKLSLDELEKVIDLDGYLRYWVIEGLVSHWDGYSANQNNFYYYVHPQTQLGYFIPWGADACFSGGNPFGGGGGGGGGNLGKFGLGGGGGRGAFGGMGNSSQSTLVYAQSILSNRLYHTEGIPERFRQTTLQVLDEAWNEQELLAEVKQVAALIDGKLHPNQGDGPGAIEGVQRYIENRREVLVKELKDWPARVPDKPRNPTYTVPVGEVYGSFTAAWWDTPADASAEEGSSDVDIVIEDEWLELETLGITAQVYKAPDLGFFGFNPQAPEPRPQVSLLLNAIRATDGEPLKITLILDREAFEAASGDEIQVTGTLEQGTSDEGAGIAAALGFNPSNRSITGILTLTQSGTNDGDPIEGELELNIMETRGGFMEQIMEAAENR